MGFIGKLLVLVHGAVSLTVLAWAIGVVTNRIDWNAPPPPGNADSPGLFAQQQAKADEYHKAIERAYTRWTTNLNQVLVLETERSPRRAYYATHLYLLESGEPNMMLGQTRIATPVQDIYPYAPNGYLDVPRDRNGNLDTTRAFARKAYEVRPGVAADSIIGYEKRMAQVVKDIQASQLASAKALEERDTLNKEIVGVTQPMRIKGLRTLINEQKEIADRALEEDRYATVFVTNREADFGLFKKRRDAMLLRSAELVKFIQDQKAK